MANEMGLVPADLAGHPGAPFTQDEVDAAVVAVRNAARWHISPEVSSVVTLDVECREPVLRLPTKHLVSVTEVRDVDLDEVISADLYRVSRSEGWVRAKYGYWPYGYERMRVTFVHGYDNVPTDLLPVLAESAKLGRRDQTATELTAGPYNVDYEVDRAVALANPLSTASVLARYTMWESGL
ncbi:hypothetical protein PJH60_23325 [Mycobacterium kansasii]